MADAKEPSNRGPRPLPLALLSLLIAPSFAPVAAATPDCALVTELPPNPTGLYVLVQPPEVWVENNQEPGLQRQTCLRADNTTAPPDLFLVNLGAVLG